MATDNNAVLGRGSLDYTFKESISVGTMTNLLPSESEPGWASSNAASIPVHLSVPIVPKGVTGFRADEAADPIDSNPTE